VIEVQEVEKGLAGEMYMHGEEEPKQLVTRVRLAHSTCFQRGKSSRVDRPLDSCDLYCLACFLLPSSCVLGTTIQSFTLIRYIIIH
jgi:hypothetical protein